MSFLQTLQSFCEVLGRRKFGLLSSGLHSRQRRNLGEVLRLFFQAVHSGQVTAKLVLKVSHWKWWTDSFGFVTPSCLVLLVSLHLIVSFTIQLYWTVIYKYGIQCLSYTNKTHTEYSCLGLAIWTRRRSFSSRGRERLVQWTLEWCSSLHDLGKIAIKGLRKQVYI